MLVRCSSDTNPAGHQKSRNGIGVLVGGVAIDGQHPDPDVLEVPNVKFQFSGLITLPIPWCNTNRMLTIEDDSTRGVGVYGLREY